MVGLGKGPRWAEVSGRPSGHQEQADPCGPGGPQSRASRGGGLLESELGAGVRPGQGWDAAGGVYQGGSCRTEGDIREQAPGSLLGGAG